MRVQVQEGEKRRLTGDLYGLRGWFKGGGCIDNLPRGTVVSFGTNAAGEACMYAYGREYPLTHALLYEARQKSELVEA